MLIIVIFSLLGYCFALTRFGKQAIEFTPLLTVSTLISLLYLFAYFGVLQIATHVLLSIGLVLFVVIPITLPRDKLFASYLTPGFIIFLLITLIFCLMAYNVPLSVWDEFSYWGIVAKAVYYNHGFITANDNITTGYPLGSSLFYYPFFLWSGGFYEGSAYVAKNILILAPLALFTKSLCWNEWRKALIYLSGAILMLLALKVRIGPIGTLYVDSLVGIYFGSAIVFYLVSARTSKDLIWLVPIVITLSLFKSIPAAYMISFIILVDHYFRRPKNTFNFRLFLLIIMLPVITYTTTKTWSIYANSIGLSTSRSLELSWEKIITSFTPNLSSGFEQEVIINFTHKLGYPLLFSIIIILFIVFSYFFNTNNNTKKEIITTHTILFFGLVGYLFSLLLLYLYAFSSVEAISTSSFERYVRIYIIGWALVAYMHFIEASRNIMNLYSSLLEYLITVLFLTLLVVYSTLYYHRYYTHHYKMQRDWFTHKSIQPITNAVKSITSPNASIFVVWQDTTALEGYMITYDLYPRKIGGGHGIALSKSEGDHWTSIYQPEAFKERIKQYDYLLLAYTNDIFWKSYANLLTNPMEKLEPIASYNLCRAPLFNGVGHPNCILKEEHAYLLKIHHKNSELILENRIITNP